MHQDVAEPAVISGRDLVKEYTSGEQTTRALDGVSIEIARGSFTAIMGPSGSGKSTLLHLLGGLDRPTSGDVHLEGKPVSTMDDRELTLLRRRRLGFVFQFFNLVPVLSVEENIALGAVIDAMPPAKYSSRMDAILRAVGLDEHRAKVPSKLSGGQQQRAAIARALFMRPAVLLADEPTGNLDSRTGGEILKVLRGARAKLGQTVVMVTHDARIASAADTIVLISDGRIAGTHDLTGVKGGDARAQAVGDWVQELGA